MSWQELINITQEAEQIAKEDKNRALVECPWDGTPLETRGNILHCPNGDFQTTRKTVGDGYGVL